MAFSYFLRDLQTLERVVEASPKQNPIPEARSPFVEFHRGWLQPDRMQERSPALSTGRPDRGHQYVSPIAGAGRVFRDRTNPENACGGCSPL